MISNLLNAIRKFFRPAPPTSPLSALESWNADFNEWLRVLQAVFNDFPDHSRFDKVQLDEKTLKLMHEITTLYLEDACNAVSGFAVKAERLQRHLNATKAEKQLPPS